MSSQSGKYGQVYFGASVYAEANKWSMAQTADGEQHGVFAGDGWKTGTVGLAGATGTIEGKYDFALPLKDYITIGDEIELKLYLTTASGPVGAAAYYTVPAQILGLSFDVDGDTGATVSWSIDWQSNGVVINP